MTSVLPRITLASVIFSSFLGASNFTKASSDKADKSTVIAKENIFHNHGYIVTHDRRGFSVKDGDQISRVKNVDLSSDLKDISAGALNKLFAKNKALRVSRVGNDYALSTQSRIKGGGAFGAWLGGWVGYASVMTGQKMITSGITYATFLICPPAAIVVGPLTDTILTVVAQPIAITAAVGGAIAGGAITGPV